MLKMSGQHQPYLFTNYSNFNIPVHKLSGDPYDAGPGMGNTSEDSYLLWQSH